MLTTYVFAGWPSENFPPEPTLSLATYPYRMLYQNTNGTWIYLASKYKLDLNRFPRSAYPSYWQFQRGVDMYNLYSYELQVSNGVGTWVDKGTSYTYLNRDISDLAYFKYVNYDIYGVTCYEDNSLSEKYLVKMNSNSASNTYIGSANIISPSENYADNSNTMVFLVDYKMYLPANADKNLLKIEITGGIAGSGETLMHDFKTVNGQWQGLFKFDRLLYPGDNTVKFDLKYNNVLVATDSVKVKYFTDFIDSNNDGKDDRTDQDSQVEYVPSDEIGIEGDWLTDIQTGLKTVKDGVNNIIPLFAATVSFLPKEWITLGTVGIGLSLFLMLVGRR